jgi:hypothetical protein
LGTAEANPQDVLEHTTELLELDQLLNDVYDYRLKGDDKFEAFATNLLRLHCLLAAVVPSTGAFTFRKWFRTNNPTGKVVDPISYDRKTLKSGRRLERLAGIRLYSGFEELDYTPEFADNIRIAGANALDMKGDRIQEVRIWKKGNQISGTLQNGLARDLAYAFFTMLAGSPLMLPYDDSVESSNGFYMGGDTVTIRDDIVPSRSGRVSTSQQYLVINTDLNAPKGIQTIQVIPDPLNVFQFYGGSLAPAYRCVSLYSFSGGSGNDVDISFGIEKIGALASEFNVETDFIWQGLVSNGGYVRIVCPAKQNPINASQERPGYWEYYGQVTDVEHIRDGSNIISIFVLASWERDGKTLNGDFVADHTYILLPDYRPAISNIANQLYSPTLDSGVEGQGYARVAQGAGLPTFDNTFYTLSA